MADDDWKKLDRDAIFNAVMALAGVEGKGWGWVNAIGKIYKERAAAASEIGRLSADSVGLWENNCDLARRLGDAKHEIERLRKHMADVAAAADTHRSMADTIRLVEQPGTERHRGA